MLHSIVSRLMDLCVTHSQAAAERKVTNFNVWFFLKVVRILVVSFSLYIGLAFKLPGWIYLKVVSYFT